MNCGSTAAKLRVLYIDSCGTDGGASEEGQVEGYGMRLILSQERCAEMLAGCGEDAGRHVAAMGDCESG